MSVEQFGYLPAGIVAEYIMFVFRAICSLSVDFQRLQADWEFLIFVNFGAKLCIFTVYLRNLFYQVRLSFEHLLFSFPEIFLSLVKLFH